MFRVALAASLSLVGFGSSISFVGVEYMFACSQVYLLPLPSISFGSIEYIFCPGRVYVAPRSSYRWQSYDNFFCGCRLWAVVGGYGRFIFKNCVFSCEYTKKPRQYSLQARSSSHFYLWVSDKFFYLLYDIVFSPSQMKFIVLLVSFKALRDTRR